MQALGELLPDRAVAASHVSFPAFVFQAVDPRSGRLTLLADILGGGGGARRDAPGDDRDRQLHVELRAAAGRDRRARSTRGGSSAPSSSTARAAAGRSAGGLGLRRDYRLLADDAEGMYYVEQTRAALRGRGPRGRRPGRDRPRVLLRRAGTGDWEELPGKGYLHLRRGDVISFVGAGGGGYGAENG